jgi:hypothetical protein
MSDDAFLEVLAGCTEVAQGMDLSDDAWKPPNGNYDVHIEDVASGTKEQGGVINAWVKPVFTILEGEFKGKSFTDYFWITPGLTEPSISLKNLCRFATCLQGAETKNPIEAAEIAKASVGEFLTVEVYRSTAKRGKNAGKEYANIRYLSRLEATTEETPVETTTEG